MGKGYNRVKSGCRTCKFRKVKCDEGRPACHRCVSNGRVCKGYGTWGGGTRINNRPEHHPLPGSSSKLALSPIKPGHEESNWLDWFKSRTAIKLQGPFTLPFWDVLALRAGLQEPSVFHALLALASLHKKRSIGAREMGFEHDPDHLERFALRHYNKAISQLLQPQFQAEDKAAVRTALISCMVFTCLEFLQGRFQTGNCHLQSGVKLLPLLQDCTGSNIDPVDSFLIGVFNRENLAALQLGNGYLAPTHPYPLTARSLPLIFGSLTQASEILDRLLNNILYLSKHPEDDPVSTQARIKSDVATWFAAFKASRFNLQASRLSPMAWLVNELLVMRSPMVKIMADTCLRDPGDEMVFNSYTADFVTIMTHAARFMQAIRRVHDSGPTVLRPTADNQFHFSVDIGWCSPLYYMAIYCPIHCRVGPIRRRAVQLLRALHFRENVWDTLLAASGAMEIIRIEEEEDADLPPTGEENQLYYRFTSEDHEKDEDKTLCSDVPVPIPPASRRVYDVQLILPD